MERLTKNENLCALCGNEECERTINSASDVSLCLEARFYNAFAAYEDTGLEPEDIIKALKTLDLFAEATKGISLNRIRELAQAEQAGRLVVLPCKVGDEVWTNFAMSGWYFRDKDRPYSARVVFVGLNDSDKMGRGLINVVYGKHDYMMQFSFADIGKSVFLSHEEAEAALNGGAE